MLNCSTQFMPDVDSQGWECIGCKKNNNKKNDNDRNDASSAIMFFVPPFCLPWWHNTCSFSHFFTFSLSLHFCVVFHLVFFGEIQFECTLLRYFKYIDQIRPQNKCSCYWSVVLRCVVMTMNRTFIMVSISNANVKFKYQKCHILNENHTCKNMYAVCAQLHSAYYIYTHAHCPLPLFCQQFEQWQTKNTIAQIITFGRIMRRVNSCHLFCTDGLHSNGNIVSVCERVCHIHRVD